MEGRSGLGETREMLLGELAEWAGVGVDGPEKALGQAENQGVGGPDGDVVGRADCADVTAFRTTRLGLGW